MICLTIWSSVWPGPEEWQLSGQPPSLPPSSPPPSLPGLTSGGCGLRHAYRVAGLVVAKTPRLTYTRTDSRCLLPRLVDWLALPLTSSRKPQPQGMTSAIRSNLHLVRLALPPPSPHLPPLSPSVSLRSAAAGTWERCLSQT